MKTYAVTERAAVIVGKCEERYLRRETEFGITNLIAFRILI